MTRIHPKCNTNQQRNWKEHRVPLWIVWLRGDTQSGEYPSPYQYHERGGIFIQWFGATSYCERKEPSTWVTTRIVGEVEGWWWWSTCASNKALSHGRWLFSFLKVLPFSPHGGGWHPFHTMKHIINMYIFISIFLNPLVLSFFVFFWIFLCRYHHLPNTYNEQLLGWERNEREMGNKDMQMTKTWPLVITSHHNRNDIYVH